MSFVFHRAFIEILSVVSLLVGGGLKPRHNLSWSKTDGRFDFWDLGFLIRRCWLNMGGIYLLILSHLLQVLRARYFCRCSFLDTGMGNNQSFV